MIEGSNEIGSNLNGIKERKNHLFEKLRRRTERGNKEETYKGNRFKELDQSSISSS